MIKGRNLHWNVYYDMLALSANEKRKVREICKFGQTYGIAWLITDTYIIYTLNEGVGGVLVEATWR